MEDDEEYSDDETVDINDENESLENVGADLLSAGSSEIRTSNSAEGRPENLSYDNDDYYYYEDETDEDYFRRKQRELRAERLRCGSSDTFTNLESPNLRIFFNEYLL